MPRPRHTDQDGPVEELKECNHRWTFAKGTLRPLSTPIFTRDGQTAQESSRAQRDALQLHAEEYKPLI